MCQDQRIVAAVINGHNLWNQKNTFEETMEKVGPIYFSVLICVLCYGQMSSTQNTADQFKIENATSGDVGIVSHRGDDIHHLDLPHTAGQLQNLLQRINDRLTTTEALANQQIRKLDNIDYRIMRLDVLGHERNNADKSDERQSRKLDNIESEMNKFGTLLDVIRDDLDRLHQRQTELKVALSSNTIQSLVSTSRNANNGKEGNSDDVSTSDQPINTSLNSIGYQVRNLTKTTDRLRDLVIDIGRNVSNVNNVTRMLTNTVNQMVTKQYFNVAIKEMLQTKQDSINFLRTSSIQGYQKEDCESSLPDDCSEIHTRGLNQSGVYRIKPQGSLEPLFVYCDLDSDGGGWTVIQNRLDGSIDFYRDWLDYKYGFGNVAGEYWLGNENIHYLTQQDVYELRIQLEDFESEKATATYSSFAVGSESDGYMIKLLGNYIGDAGDSFTYHVGVKFSTRDLDQDNWDDGNCAEAHPGGWWYKGCDMTNLNGRYLTGDLSEDLHYQGVYWYEWHGPQYSLQKTVMKIRPASFGKLK